MKKLSQDEVIAKAKLKHGDLYDYSATVYENMRTKMSITCRVHGIFQQYPYDHISGHGCPLCGFNVPRNEKWRANNNSGLVEGIGINDLPYMANGSTYLTWHNLLKRCYNRDIQKKQPIYEGCRVCDEWLTFSNFKRWFESPENGYRDGYELDKDILVKGNKVYSPETCCIAPKAINKLFGYHNNKMSNLPHGVYPHNGRYRAVLNHDGKNFYLGIFDSPEDAFSAYKQAKESYIKEVAESYFLRGEITERLYLALYNYEVG